MNTEAPVVVAESKISTSNEYRTKNENTKILQDDEEDDEVKQRADQRCGNGKRIKTNMVMNDAMSMMMRDAAKRGDDKGSSSKKPAPAKKKPAPKTHSSRKEALRIQRSNIFKYFTKVKVMSFNQCTGQKFELQLTEEMKGKADERPDL